MTDTEVRKDHHLRICLEEDIAGLDVKNGFERYRFDHDALPEVSKAEIRTEISFFGKTLRAPLMIGAMTGGSTQAGQINRILAEAAERRQIAFALGSQRRMLEDPRSFASYDVRKIAPSVLLMGNIGAVQLNYGVGASQIQMLIEKSGLDLMAFHLNPLQEAIQPEGDTTFVGLTARLQEIIPQLPCPSVLKEVGAGISAKTACKISMLPLGALEIAGVGGTSWAKVESFRTNNRIQAETGVQLASWGIPTAESLVTCRRLLPQLPLICSGGMRTGLEMAKAIALGADLVAMALPFLHAAQHGVDAVLARIDQIIEELRTVMFVTGAGSISALRTDTVIRRIGG